MNISPNEVYKDLSSFGDLKHERLGINSQGIPCTESKLGLFGRIFQWFFKPMEKRIATIADKALTFFETDSLSIDQRWECLSKIQIVVFKTKNSQLIDRCNQLLNKTRETKDKQFEIKSQEEIRKLKTTNQSEMDKFQLAKNRLEAESVQLQKTIDEQKQLIAQEALKREQQGQKESLIIQQKINALQKDLLSLQQDKNDVFDTVLVGQGDLEVPVLWRWLVGSDLAFFKCSMMLDKKAKSTEKLKVDLKDFSKRTLELFVEHLRFGKFSILSISEIVDLVKFLNFTGMDNSGLKSSIIQSINLLDLETLKKLEEQLLPLEGIYPASKAFKDYLSSKISQLKDLKDREYQLALKKSAFKRKVQNISRMRLLFATHDKNSYFLTKGNKYVEGSGLFLDPSQMTARLELMLNLK